MSRWRGSSGRGAYTASRRRIGRIAGRGGGGRTTATTVVGPRRPDQPEIRVGQADRERVVGRLCAAAGEGRLTLAEAADRQAAAYAACFPRDLAPLLVDLPTDDPAVRSVDAAPLSGASRTHLRQALRVILLINSIALCVGLSAFPGAAGLVALLSVITIMLAVVAAECVGVLGDGRPRGRAPRAD